MEFGRGPSGQARPCPQPPGQSPPATPLGSVVSRGLRTPQTGRLRTRSGGLSNTQTQSPGTQLTLHHHSRLSQLQSPATGGSNRQATSTDLGRSPDDNPISGRVCRVFNSLSISTRYSLEEQIGEGTFSTVYLAKRQGETQSAKEAESSMALKLLVPTSKPGRISMEVRCMRESAGHPNVIPLLGVWRAGGDVVLGMPFVDHCKFMDLVATVELEEVKLYIANLLSAVGHIHRLGIIHRDIKPSNFLYDRRRKKFALVDFGLAQWVDESSQEMQGRGTKRRAESDSSEENKRPRIPLGEANSKLNCTPRTRVIRDLRSAEVRRSPRKMLTPDQQRGEELEVVSPASGDTREPKQRISFGQPSRLSLNTRSSPRKLGLPGRAGGVSKLTIQMNSVLPAGEGNISNHTPTLSRANSFTMLEPSCLSQATDYTGRTPLLRASVTSNCSSTLPRPDLGTPRPVSTSRPAPPACSCRGLLQVCDACQALSHLHAARAGTPGFRPPEVLLKCHTQTVAVDMWAVGVVLLSLLARAYPFFRSPDDMTAVSELCTLFGTKAVVTAANK